MNSFLISNLFLAFAFLFTPSISQSKLFKSSYVSFELPETWDCKAFEQNWVCHDKYQEKKVEALITLTAKIADGDFDKTTNYLAYLKEEKIWVTQTGEEVTSKKMGSDAKYIYPNKFPWVEATHLNSEVKSYISRYVGTVCCENSSSQLGILLVLSAHQNLWSKYASIFLKAINSLKLLDIEDAISKVRAAEFAKTTGQRGAYIDGLLQDDAMEGLNEGFGSFLDDPFNLLLLGAALLALIAFYIIKKRRSKKKKRRLKRRKKK